MLIYIKGYNLSYSLIKPYNHILCYDLDIKDIYGLNIINPDVVIYVYNIYTTIINDEIIYDNINCVYKLYKVNGNDDSQSIINNINSIISSL